MKITNLKWQNILSWGNDVTEMDFDSPSKILIKGEQGQGKSSIIDILCFAIYGKSLRSGNTKNIINSHNNANLYTEVAIANNDVVYKIVRYKRTQSTPIITEFYKNDTPVLDLDKDLITSYIEDYIVGISWKDFTKLCVIEMPQIAGDGNFKDYLTSLYDLSHIDEIHQDYLKEHKRINNKMMELTSSIYKINQDITQIEKINAINNETIVTAIKQYEDANITNNDRLNKLNELLVDTQTQASVYSPNSIGGAMLNNKLKEAQSKYAELTQQINIRLYQIGQLDVDVCNSCKQAISSEYKASETNRLNLEIEKIKEEITSLDLIGIQNEINKNNENYNLFAQKINSISNSLQQAITAINTNKNTINILNKQMELHTNNNIMELQNAKADKDVELEMVQSRKSIIDIIIDDVFGEYGYKYEYLLNKLTDINAAFETYLPRFEIDPITVFIDELFNMRVYRMGIELPYNMMSNGEKMIINSIFILHKLSLQSNIGVKIFDEVLDSSLTKVNLNIMMNLINEIYENELLIFITHKLQDTEIFNSIYEVSKMDTVHSNLKIN